MIESPFKAIWGFEATINSMFCTFEPFYGLEPFALLGCRWFHCLFWGASQPFCPSWPFARSEPLSPLQARIKSHFVCCRKKSDDTIMRAGHTKATNSQIGWQVIYVILMRPFWFPHKSRSLLLELFVTGTVKYDTIKSWLYEEPILTFSRIGTVYLYICINKSNAGLGSTQRAALIIKSTQLVY